MTQRDKIKEADLKGSDPSALTTQVIWREIAALKELLTSELEGVKKSIDVAHDDLVRVPTDVQEQVGNVHQLLDIKVAHLEKQFDLIERQRIEQKTDQRTAIDDALKAAKELVFQQNLANTSANAKSEASFSKQIDQIATLFASEKKASDERINDLKEQVAKSEGRGGGLKDFAGWVVAAIAILFSLLNYLNT